MNMLTKSAGLGLLAVVLLASTSALAGGIKITFPKEMVEAAQVDSRAESAPVAFPINTPPDVDLSNPLPGGGKPGIDLSVIDPKGIQFLPGPKLEMIPVEKGTVRKADNGVLLALGCVVTGIPATLMLVNQSNVALPEGTKISWRVKANGLKGYFALKTELATGAGFAANGILDGGVIAGTNCSAKVM